MLENIRDVQVTQTQRIRPDGRVTPAYVVRYFVGDHGPFDDFYDEELFRPEAVQRAFIEKIKLLHSIGAPLSHAPTPNPAQPGDFMVTGRPVSTVPPPQIPQQPGATGSPGYPLSQPPTFRAGPV